MALLLYQADLNLVKDHLYDLLSRQLPAASLSWIDKKLVALEGGTEKEFYLSFSAVPRYCGKQPLNITVEDLLKAGVLRKGWNYSSWYTDQAIRVLFLVSAAITAPQNMRRLFETLISTADVGEQTALYSCLPLLPYPEEYIARTSEGIRTNMADVFDTIVLGNPYPSEYLGEGEWNQMVLKAVFQEKPLYRIYGLDQRTNPTLARMLSDYAHERWAAGRLVSPELWRAVGPFINGNLMRDLERVLDNDDLCQKEAALLACNSSSYSEAVELLDQNPDIKVRIRKGDLTWNILGEKWHTEKIMNQ